VSYDVATESCELFLLHKTPMEITLDTVGGEAETYSIAVNGCDLIKAADLPLPTRDGYKFVNWYKNDNYTLIYRENQPITRDITLYAKWIKICIITIVTNCDETAQPLDLLEGDSFNPPDAPIKAGYKFMSWYTDEDFVSKLPNYTQTATDSLTLYARFEKLHTVQFNTNGGTAKESVQIANGEALDLDKIINPTKPDLIFNGWFLDADFTEEYTASSPISGDITLNAYWCWEYYLSRLSQTELLRFFDISCTFERILKDHGSYLSNTIIYTVTISMKEEYLKYERNISCQLEVLPHGAKYYDLGNYYTASFNFNTATKTFVTEIEASKDFSKYEYTETVDINIRFTFARFIFPEGFSL
jgi:uncharacterized repeat protein (TIGR02543 family)